MEEEGTSTTRLEEVEPLAKQPRLSNKSKWLREEVDECMAKMNVDEEKIIDTPCDTNLREMVEIMVKPTSKYSTILVLGPKGCGKTTSGKLLHNRDEFGLKSAYYDFGQNYSNDICETLSQLSEEKIELLILDNMQDISPSDISFYIHPLRFKYIVGIFSAGVMNRDVTDKIRKIRGDGTSLIVDFCPLDQSHSKALLVKRGVNIKTVDSSSVLTLPSEKDFQELTEEGLQKLVYITGGVPRYLDYCVDLGCKKGLKQMEVELQRQLFSLVRLKEGDRTKVAKLLKNFVISNQLCNPLDEVVQCGLGYVLDGGRGCLVSPIYMNLILELEGLISCEDSWTDWQSLEKHTLMLLQFQKNTAHNCHGQTLDIPKPIETFCQKEIGDMPPIINKGTIILVSFAPYHPAADAAIFDCRNSQAKVYYVQTSFTQYSRHGSKIDSLTTMKVNRNWSVIKYYESKLKEKNNSIKQVSWHYVYSTPEFEKKGTDENVYFLDARNQWYRGDGFF